MLGILRSLLFSASMLHAAASQFVLKPEWTGPCQASSVVDVNLGNTPSTFIQACFCQIEGKMPAQTLVTAWTDRLAQNPDWRRVDVVRTLAKELGRSVKLAYSNPWTNNPELPPAGPKTSKRDIGAVFMFFFHCPGGVNCGMDWANNHVEGMDAPSQAVAFNGQPGFYQPSNPGFWLRELRDARAAGLDFFLLNCYGPDLAEGGLQALAQAYAAEPSPVKIALMDDTWAWGEHWFGPAWMVAPNFSDPARAAAKLYEAKWKPFFSLVPRADWYLVNGRPLIYFYNSGKLVPVNVSAETVRRMKARFERDFGVEPFVAVDRAYFADPDMDQVADAKFIWDPLTWGDTPDKISWSRMRGLTLCHAITRWDSVGRDKPGMISGPGDRIMKGPAMLESVLAATGGAQVLTLGTWNDLGEGTGLNRAYDYWYNGQWLAPDTFINIIRDSRNAQ
ncbi:MAG TPA: DUF5010 domain-containing protein [bacterium]|jgi:hypothetical protein|nr:DUF5010 domain-containing protein [bacterium]